MKKIIATFSVLSKFQGELVFYALVCLMLLSAVFNIYCNL